MLESCILDGPLGRPGCISGVGSGCQEMAWAAGGSLEGAEHASVFSAPSWGIWGSIIKECWAGISEEAPAVSWRPGSELEAWVRAGGLGSPSQHCLYWPWEL